MTEENEYFTIPQVITSCLGLLVPLGLFAVLHISHSLCLCNQILQLAVAKRWNVFFTKKKAQNPY